MSEDIQEKENFYRDYYVLVEAISKGDMTIEDLYAKYPPDDLSSILTNTINMGFITLAQLEELMQFIVNMLYYTNIAITGEKEYKKTEVFSAIFNKLSEKIIKEIRDQLKKLVKMEDVSEENLEIFQALLGQVGEAIEGR